MEPKKMVKKRKLLETPALVTRNAFAELEDEKEEKGDLDEAKEPEKEIQENEKIENQEKRKTRLL